MDEFAWTREQAVLYNNAFYAGLSVISLSSFLSVKILTKMVDPKFCCTCE